MGRGLTHAWILDLFKCTEGPQPLKPNLGNSWILGTFGMVTPPLLNKQEGDDQVEKPILEDEEDVEANKEHIMRHHLSSTAGICYP